MLGIAISLPRSATSESWFCDSQRFASFIPEAPFLPVVSRAVDCNLAEFLLFLSQLGKITMPRLTWHTLTLHLRNPFRLSYGVSETRQAFWLRLDNDEGWGEGTIPPYYRV